MQSRLYLSFMIMHKDLLIQIIGDLIQITSDSHLILFAFAFPYVYAKDQQHFSELHLHQNLN